MQSQFHTDISTLPKEVKKSIREKKKNAAEFGSLKKNKK